MTFNHTQPPASTSAKCNNLFYVFENGALGTGSRVLLTLDGIYDSDGDFSTEEDQVAVGYQVALAGASNNGQLVRNGYYRVAVGIAGLAGQDVVADITVANWETPTTQNINLGQ